MCLLSVSLDTLGLLLRIWLWISVPMAVVILLVASYFNYWHNAKSKVFLKLAIEGWGADGREPFIKKEDVVGEGEALLGEEQEETTPRGPVREDATTENTVNKGAEEREEAELGPTGKETIYRGILWMKERYEQYREQADRKFDQLREELGRSEHRYHELLTTMEHNKNQALDVVESDRPVPAKAVQTETKNMEPSGLSGTSGSSGIFGPGGISGSGEIAGLNEMQAQLSVRQATIDKLEAQLRSERAKVEELVAILQANMQMLRKVVPDLGK